MLKEKIIRFDQLSPESRIWIYQSPRPFSENDIQAIKTVLENFISGWDSHGNKIFGSYNIFYNQFVVVGVDESVANASGCSIDKLTRTIKEIEHLTGNELLNNGNIAYKKGDDIKIIPFNKVKQAVAEGEIEKETILFNNTINNLKELKEKWEVPASKAWTSKFFNNL
ncbi:MAG: hypothetical protein ACK40G_13525 [Cytophagaceae bacterium]